MLARSLPAIFVVRASLRRRKGGASTWILPSVASLLAVALLGLLVAVRLAPAIALTLGVLLLVRAGCLLWPGRPAWPARRIGQAEAAWGILYVLLLGANWSSLP